MPTSSYPYDASSIMSRELDTTKFFDSENEDQFSSVTESTTMWSRHYGLHRKKRLKHKLQSNGVHHVMDRAPSVSIHYTLFLILIIIVFTIIIKIYRICILL